MKFPPSMPVFHGLRFIIQANGQVCFLQLHHGNHPISIAELEAMYR
jgi:hypothetical protein